MSRKILYSVSSPTPNKNFVVGAFSQDYHSEFYEKAMMHAGANNLKPPEGLALENMVGFAAVNFQSHDNSYHVGSVEVQADFQRQGIASELYNLVESTTGTKLIPSPMITTEGQKFWKDRKQVTAAVNPRLIAAEVKMMREFAQKYVRIAVVQVNDQDGSWIMKWDNGEKVGKGYVALTQAYEMLQKVKNGMKSKLAQRKTAGLSLPWTRKPANWEHIKQVNFQQLDSELQKQIEQLPETQGEAYLDLTSNRRDQRNSNPLEDFEQWVPFVPAENIFILRVLFHDADDFESEKSYVVDRSGYNYMRYAVELLNFTGGQETRNNMETKLTKRAGNLDREMRPGSKIWDIEVADNAKGVRTALNLVQTNNVPFWVTFASDSTHSTLALKRFESREEADVFALSFNKENGWFDEEDPDAGVDELGGGAMVQTREEVLEWLQNLG